MKFTPGPWYVTQHPDYPWARARIGDSPDAPWIGFGAIGYVDMKNARLIAKAPEMYEELRKLANVASSMESITPYIRRARNLVEEIEGE